MFSSLLYLYLGVGFLGHKQTLCITFWGTSGQSKEGFPDPPRLRVPVLICVFSSQLLLLSRSSCDKHTRDLAKSLHACTSSGLRRATQSILKEVSPGISLEGMMLKLKLQYFGYLMGRVDSLEKTLMLGGIASVHEDSPGKNTGTDCHALLQGIFPTQDRTQVSHIAGGFFTLWATRVALDTYTSGQIIQVF